MTSTMRELLLQCRTRSPRVRYGLRASVQNRTADGLSLRHRFHVCSACTPRRRDRRWSSSLRHGSADVANGSTITLSVDRNVLPINGQATVTRRGRSKLSARPCTTAPMRHVHGASIGSVNPPEAQTVNGIATRDFLARQRPAPASFTRSRPARTDPATRSGGVEVKVGAAAAGSMSLQRDAAERFAERRHRDDRRARPRFGRQSAARRPGRSSRRRRDAQRHAARRRCERHRAHDADHDARPPR